MANTVTVASVITRARRLADMENTQFILDAEAADYIDAAYKRLYNLMVEAHEDWFLKEHTFSTVSGTNEYSVPSDFYKLLALDVQVGSTYRPIRRFMLSERNKILYGDNSPSHYSLYQSTIRFYPDPTGAQTIRMWYVPVPATLTSASSFDAINGWDDWIAHDVAITMLNKEESDASVLIRKRDQLEARLLQFMQGRDEHRPQRIRNVEEEYDPILRWRT